MLGGVGGITNVWLPTLLSGAGADGVTVGAGALPPGLLDGRLVGVNVEGVDGILGVPIPGGC